MSNKTEDCFSNESMSGSRPAASCGNRVRKRAILLFQSEFNCHVLRNRSAGCWSLVHYPAFTGDGEVNVIALKQWQQVTLWSAGEIRDRLANGNWLVAADLYFTVV